MKYNNLKPVGGGHIRSLSLNHNPQFHLSILEDT